MWAIMNHKAPKPRNFVAKHMRALSGAGRHEAKFGKTLKRAKQKQQFQKELRNIDY